MAKKNKKNYRFKKRYSFSDRSEYYQKKVLCGKTAKEQDYATGYLQGMRGVRDRTLGSDAADAGNEAGLRFWHKMTNHKF